MKKILGLTFLALNFISSSAQAALEIVSVTFHENEWVSEFGTPWHYSEVGDTVLDIKALINDNHSEFAPIRSYILEYNKRAFLGGFATLDWTGHIDFNQALLKGLEIRTRVIQGGTGDTGSFALQIDGIQGPFKKGPNPNPDFGPGFRSVVVPIPQGNMNGDWKLVIRGKVEINQLIFNIHTHGQKCLRNLCN